MQANTLTIELPVPLDLEEARLMIFASLFGKGALSSGKAAFHLGMRRTEFLEKVGLYGISIFSDDAADLENALNIKL